MLKAMSDDPPPVEPVAPSERLYDEAKSAEQQHFAKSSMEAFSVALAKADRSGGNALTTDSVGAKAPRHEHTKKMLGELAHAIAGNETPSHSAPAEIDHRVAQAQIEAAHAQRDAAIAQKMAALAILALITASLLGGVFALLLPKLKEMIGF
jgi:hypothetical protein